MARYEDSPALILVDPSEPGPPNAFAQWVGETIYASRMTGNLLTGLGYMYEGDTPRLKDCRSKVGKIWTVPASHRVTRVWEDTSAGHYWETMAKRAWR